VRGDGRIFKRAGRWWIAYYAPRSGRAVEFREPAFIVERAGEDPRPAKTEQEARRALKERRRQILGERFVAPPERRTTVGELLDAFILQLKTKGLRSVDKTTSHTGAIRRAFGDLRPADLTTPKIERYTQDRLAAGRARATVNRELETLRQALTLAARRTPPLLTRVPTSPA
jgi:hypothetical protein